MYICIYVYIYIYTYINYISQYTTKMRSTETLLQRNEFLYFLLKDLSF